MNSLYTNTLRCALLIISVLSVSLLKSEVPLRAGIEVARLYQAALEKNATHMENNLEWHRALDKKKPEQMLTQALDIAVKNNDAQTAVLLTTRLKEEQKGAWERYFRGITLVSCLTIIAVAIGVTTSVKANKNGNQGGDDQGDVFVVPGGVIETEEQQGQAPINPPQVQTGNHERAADIGSADPAIDYVPNTYNQQRAQEPTEYKQ